MKKLEGKTAIVTGASTGIGRAVAIKYAEHGANLVLTSNTSVNEGEKVLSEVHALGSKAIYVSADLQNQNGVDSLFCEIKKTFDRVDILVNNAGRTYNIGFDDISEESFLKDIRVNLLSALLCSQAVQELMDTGWIINTASIRGLPNSGRPGIIGYSAAKSAIVSLTQNMAMQLAPKIFVNAVAPGFVYTNYMNSVSDEMKNQWLSQIPINRFIDPTELSEVYLLLATTKIFTGSVIVPDGGYTLLGR